MIRTDKLIATLADDKRPVPSALPRLAIALLAGEMMALAGLVLVLGSPLETISARGVTASALKLSYPLAIGLIAAAAALAAGRPGARFTPRLSLLALPLVLVVIATFVDLAAAPPALRDDLLFGSTYATCVTVVALASVPPLVGLTWAYRILAPTEPPVAGFLIGLSAGGAAAVAYALYCPELSPAFLLAAYTPAMMIPALAGAMAGRLTMRW